MSKWPIASCTQFTVLCFVTYLMFLGCNDRSQSSNSDNNLQTSTGHQITIATPELKALIWNIDGLDDGKCRKSIDRLIAEYGFNFIALTGVPENRFEMYGQLFGKDCGTSNIQGQGGRIVCCWDPHKFVLHRAIQFISPDAELLSMGTLVGPRFIASSLHHPTFDPSDVPKSPVQLDLVGGLIVARIMCVSLSSVDSQLRNQQLMDLSNRFAKTSDPVLVVGDLQLDYDIILDEGNEAFEYLRNRSPFNWIAPEVGKKEVVESAPNGSRNQLLQSAVLVCGNAKSIPIKTRILDVSVEFPDSNSVHPLLVEMPLIEPPPQDTKPLSE